MASPSQATLQQLLELVAERVAKCLEREGLLVRDAQYASLTLPEPDVFDQVLQCSTTYRVAFGSRTGRKTLVLRTISAVDPSANSTLLSPQVDQSSQSDIGPAALALKASPTLRLASSSL